MPSIRIEEFDTWQPGYGLASVQVLLAGSATRAELFTDEDLTETAENPQTLTERVVSGVSYGKFSVPLYVGTAYELLINSVDRTGVQRVPISDLEGEDASLATVKVTGGEEDITLADHLARVIDVRDQGEFIAVGGAGASASTNNATLVAALGVAGAAGGGFVEVPAGTYLLTSYTIPQGVIIRGKGRGVTILHSTQAGNVATIGGARAGFCRMTLDGVTLVSGSVGMIAVNKDQIVLDDVEIKRFETCIYRKGGVLSRWRELYLSNATNGYKAHGDLASGLGAAADFNTWTGGKVDSCTAFGVEIKYVDAECKNQIIDGVSFEDNTGTAVKVTGARSIAFRNCRWDGNTKNLVVADGSPATANNTVIGLEATGGSMEDGTIEMTGTLESVAFRRMTFKTVAVTLTTPKRNILVEDCREISGMTFAGTATAWTRKKTGDRGASSGLTTGNTATKAWSIALLPGQRVYLEAKVIGRGRNVTDDAFYHIAVSARRPVATLAYDTQTANFTVGNVLTGATSGATARIVADSDSGATGTLSLQDVVGTFVDNEIITDAATGSATVNGSLSTSNAELAGSVTNLRAVQETDAAFAATFAANGPEIELQVTGNTSKTVEWTPDVEVVST